MTEPTETERREMNRRLARAMGIADDRWTFQCLKEDHLLDGHGPHAFCLTCAAPVNKSALVPPDFTRDLAASRELVGWVATSNERWRRFTYRLHDMLDIQYGDLSWHVSRRLMTASPLLIAIAADAATGGKDGR